MHVTFRRLMRVGFRLTAMVPYMEWAFQWVNRGTMLPACELPAIWATLIQPRLPHPSAPVLACVLEIAEP